VFFKNVHASNELPSYNFNRHFFGHNLSPAPYFYSINCLRLTYYKGVSHAHEHKQQLFAHKREDKIY